MLGWPSVAAGLRGMSSREFAEWMALMAFEPPDWNEEYRTALLASILANTARDEKKRRRPFEVREFMRANYVGESKPGDEEALLRKMEAVMVMLGGERIPRDGG